MAEEMTRISYQPPQLVCSFPAHEGGTTSASFAPDGRTLATGGYDCAVRLWDVETWQQNRTLIGHRRGHVAFSPDGILLVSGGLHKNATVYETATWQARRTLNNTSGVWDLAFAPTGSLLAITQPGGGREDPDRPIELRNTRTWRIAARMGVGAATVFAVSFHPDGRRLAVAPPGGLVGIWSADLTERLCEFRAHEQATWGLAFSPDGAMLTTGGADNVLRLWETSEWGKTHEVARVGMTAEAGLRDAVLCAAFSPDGKLLATGGLDGAATVWRLS